MDINSILGKKSRKSIKKDELITLDDLE